jgi:hypothetical protein
MSGITLNVFIEELQSFAATVGGDCEVLLRRGPQVSVSHDTPSISFFVLHGERILELS